MFFRTPMETIFGLAGGPASIFKEGARVPPQTAAATKYNDRKMADKESVI